MLQNKKLAAWLEAILQREVGAPQTVKSDPVTFAVLYAHSRVELNVERLDPNGSSLSSFLVTAKKGLASVR